MVLTANEIVAKTGELPSFPHVAAKVMKLVSNPDTSAKELQDVIITDQGLTARILKISNSAMFGLKREVKTLTHAIMLLGFNTIRSIVIASAAKNVFTKSNDSKSSRRIWENAFGCATISRLLSAHFSSLNKEEAFIGGLMHNVGKTILSSRMAEEYSAVLARSQAENIPEEELEKETFGFDHTEIGHIILQQWNFSGTLTESVRWYTNPAGAAKEHRQLTGVIGVAGRFCRALGLGYERNMPLEQQNLSVYLEVLGVSDKDLETWYAKAQEVVKQDASLVSSL